MGAGNSAAHCRMNGVHRSSTCGGQGRTADSACKHVGNTLGGKYTPNGHRREYASEAAANSVPSVKR